MKLKLLMQLEEQLNFALADGATVFAATDAKTGFAGPIELKSDYLLSRQ